MEKAGEVLAGRQSVRRWIVPNLMTDREEPRPMGIAGARLSDARHIIGKPRQRIAGNWLATTKSEIGVSIVSASAFARIESFRERAR